MKLSWKEINKRRHIVEGEEVNDTDAKIRALTERVDKLEHALLVLATWHHGKDEYVKSILGPEAVQCAEVEHGYCSDEPMCETKQWVDWIGKKLKEEK